MALFKKNSKRTSINNSNGMDLRDIKVNFNFNDPKDSKLFRISKGTSEVYSGINKERKIGARTRLDLSFTPQEFNLANIAALYDTEPFFSQLVEKVIQRMFKSGFSIVGDPQAVKYVDDRISKLEISRNETFKSFLEGWARDLITYCNVFHEKIRDRKAPVRKWTRSIYGTLEPPIISYKRIDPPLMRIAVSKKGYPLKYLQAIEVNTFIDREFFYNKGKSQYPIFDPVDMIHHTHGRKGGMTFGTPFILQSIDDIKALRVMEECAEVIVFQFAKPILVYTVSGQAGATPNSTRTGVLQSVIDEVNTVLEEMLSIGHLVVGKDDKVEYIGANKNAIDITPYLKYMMERTWYGMGVDEVTMGRGSSSNRDTAQSLTENMIYLVAHFQSKLKEGIEWYIFREWMHEGRMIGEVELFFPEIDRVAKETSETHATNMFNNNAWTHEELRRAIGKPPLPNNDDLFVERIQLFADELMTRLESKLNVNSVSQSSKVNLNKKRETKSRVMPTNQYGTKPKPKVKKD